ncbi:unnamed protein product [Toxocara canis]|uniref:Midasin n=1 Tax=Toxocara canis TaxID=6265 RepID=A0A183V005_TOXCA|nr:unnamed protein product [Toxocara canis]
MKEEDVELRTRPVENPEGQDESVVANAGEEAFVNEEEDVELRTRPVENPEGQDESVVANGGEEVFMKEEDVELRSDEGEHMRSDALEIAIEQASDVDQVVASTTLGKRSRNESENETTEAKRHIGELQTASVVQLFGKAMSDEEISTKQHSSSVQDEEDANTVEQTNEMAGAVEGNEPKAIDEDNNVGTNVSDVSERNSSVDEEELNMSRESGSTQGSSQNTMPQEVDFDDSDNSNGSAASSGGSVSGSVMDFAEEHIQFEMMTNDAEDELREREQNHQTEDIEQFSAEFERRVASLPLSKALIEYVKHLP